ncbi:hypothetical protein TURU_063040 [Turdus rufiventris]|nr:hypothetical protein TURU_063040 [Turdus rufiventris]
MWARGSWLRVARLPGKDHGRLQARLPRHALPLDLEETIPEYHPALLGLSFLQGSIPWHSTKQTPEEAKVCPPEAQGSELIVYHPHSPKDLELHHFMVTIVQGVLELHIPYQPLLVGENKVQYSTSPCWLLFYLEKEVVISTFQEPPRLLMPCCVVSPTDVRVVEVPHEDQGCEFQIHKLLIHPQVFHALLFIEIEDNMAFLSLPVLSKDPV